MKKARLDKVLVDRAIYPTRERAQRAVMAGEVKIGEQIADKPSLLVNPDISIATAEPPRFVGRGGLKLEGALDFFEIQVRDAIALDIGASTGGFTDCLLQRGAAKVYAVDVGYGQLAWKIRTDPRVIVFEKTNARTLSSALISQPVDLCVIDVSFISLTLILPNAFQLITPNGIVLALIKPQFELSRGNVGRGGIVREPALHKKAQDKVAGFIEKLGYRVVGITPSPITGTDGNQEFFVCAGKQSH
jgi:23S rRNA (cytidine1920-2'-O)/16S rRNA (cytidine1409-2'-O)-methyltransferase